MLFLQAPVALLLFNKNLIRHGKAVTPSPTRFAGEGYKQGTPISVSLVFMVI